MKTVMTVMSVLASVALVIAPAWNGSAVVLGQDQTGNTEILGGGVALGAADKKAEVNRPVLRSTAEKRRWLRGQLASGVTNRRELVQLQGKVDQLTPRQVDALTNAVLAQQLPVGEQPQQVQQQMQQFDQQQQQVLQQANQELARLQFLRQALENEMWLRNSGYGVGYAPVVTWLPEGTWFGASANVSPDGRYARINANPYYSSVGPVYTYNLNNGATRSWMPQPGYQTNHPNHRPLGSPGYNHAETYGGIPTRQQSQAPAAAPPASQPRVWHDGVRTRVGP
jgi:hypothetical protein